MSTMLHPYADGEDESVVTFHSARASSFYSNANTIDVFLDKSGNDDDDATMRESVGGNSSILFDSGFVDRFTSRADDHAAYGDDDCISRISGIKSGRCNRPKMRRSTEQDRLQHYLRRKMLRQLREGDNGNTYLAELKQNKTRAMYTIKVMHKDQGSKFWAVETERNVLKSLNHPFLPTVYADVDSEEYAFLVMDFCSRGDLRALRQWNPLREEVARVYAAEVLLGVEYLHAHGIIYRGLKPENVMIRANGHIMLSGFDRAMWRTPPQTTRSRNSSSTTCFSGFLQHVVGSESEEGGRRDVLLPPEVLKGKQHDDAADWYTYGIFLYELLFGTTPFKAHDDRVTCVNVVASQRLKFPREPVVSSEARDLLRRLLNVNPKRRLGYEGGAAEVKKHAFFQGMNFALLREMATDCRKAPELPNKL